MGDRPRSPRNTGEPCGREVPKTIQAKSGSCDRRWRAAGSAPCPRTGARGTAGRRKASRAPPCLRRTTPVRGLRWARAGFPGCAAHTFRPRRCTASTMAIACSGWVGGKDAVPEVEDVGGGLPPGAGIPNAVLDLLRRVEEASSGPCSPAAPSPALRPSPPRRAGFASSTATTSTGRVRMAVSSVAQSFAKWDHGGSPSGSGRRRPGGCRGGRTPRSLRE